MRHTLADDLAIIRAIESELEAWNTKRKSATDAIYSIWKLVHPPSHSFKYCPKCHKVFYWDLPSQHEHWRPNCNQDLTPSLEGLKESKKVCVRFRRELNDLSEHYHREMGDRTTWLNSSEVYRILNTIEGTIDKEFTRISAIDSAVEG